MAQPFYWVKNSDYIQCRRNKCANIEHKAINDQSSFPSRRARNKNKWFQLLDNWDSPASCPARPGRPAGPARGWQGRTAVLLCRVCTVRPVRSAYLSSCPVLHNREYHYCSSGEYQRNNGELPPARRLHSELTRAEHRSVSHCHPAEYSRNKYSDNSSFDIRNSFYAVKPSIWLVSPIHWPSLYSFPVTR